MVPSIKVIRSPELDHPRTAARCPAVSRPSPPQTSATMSESGLGSTSTPRVIQRSSNGLRSSCHSSAMPPSPNQAISSPTSTGVCATPCVSPSNTRPVRRNDSRTVASASASTCSPSGVASKACAVAVSDSIVSTLGITVSFLPS